MTVMNTQKRISAENEYLVSDIEVDGDKFVIRGGHLVFISDDINPFRVENGHLFYTSDEDNCVIDRRGHVIIDTTHRSQTKLNITRRNLYTDDIESSYISVSGNPFEENEMVVTDVALSLVNEAFSMVDGELVYATLGENPFSIDNNGNLIYTSDGENPYSIQDGYLYTSAVDGGTSLKVTKKNTTTKEIIIDFIPFPTDGGGGGINVDTYFDELANLLNDGE